MAKLLLLLVFVCFQFSSQEELAAKPENDLGKPEIESGKPENEQVYPENELVKQEKEEVIAEPIKLENESKKKYDDKWTEQDEKWLQEIIDLLTAGSKEDDDYDSEEFDKLMEELDKYFEESDESYEDWYDSDEWDDDWDININHYPDYFNGKKEAKKEVGVAGKDKLDLFYSWLYRKQLKNAEKQMKPTKRFTSV